MRIFAHKQPKMKARIKYKAEIISAQGGASRIKSAFVGSEFVEPQEVRIISQNTVENTVVIIDPLDPERVLVIAAEAVEIYNEAVGVWQSIVAVAKKIKAFFVRLFKK